MKPRKMKCTIKSLKKQFKIMQNYKDLNSSKIKIMRLRMIKRVLKTESQF